MNTTKCTVTNADLESEEFGDIIGTVELELEEAHHFDNSGAHLATVSLSDEQQKAIGLNPRCESYIKIRRVA